MKPVEESPADWKSLLEQIKSNSGQLKAREHSHMRRSIQAWSIEHITEALDEIDTLPPSRNLDSMKNLLIDSLGRADPKQLLERFADQIDDETPATSTRLTEALGKWAAQEPREASAWLDQQIANGYLATKNLDGSNLNRLTYEAALVAACVNSDLSLAQRRVGLTPISERELLLHNVGVSDVDVRGYAELVRENLPPEDASKTLQTKASYFVSKSYQAVDEFLTAIDATSEERTAVVNQAGSMKIRQLSQQETLPRQEIDQLRQWSEKQSPGSGDKLAGKVIAAFDSVPFSEKAAALDAYQQTGSGDELIISFLDNYSAEDADRPLIRGLIEKINDPETREMLLEESR